MATFFINTQDAQISNAFIATLGAAPGATYLAQIKAFGLTNSVNAMINATGKTTASDLADTVVANLGLTGAAATAGKAYLTSVTFTGAKSAAWGANLMATLDLFTTLQSDATYGTAASNYVARINSAVAYSNVATNNSTDLTTLAAAIGSAGSTGAGSTFTLTTGVDSPSSTSGNDIYKGLAGAVADNTFQTFDTIDGGAGTDTLQVSVAGDATGVAANVQSIEVLELRSVDSAAQIKANIIGGLETIRLNNGVDTIRVDNIGAVAKFELQNQLVAGDADFRDGTATALNLTANAYGKNATTGAVQLAVDFRDNEFTSATLNLTNSNLEILSTTGGDDDIKTASIAATGTNTLAGTIFAGALETLTVTGTGSLDMSGVTLGALKTLTATGNSGGIKVDVDDTAVTVSTGSGTDTVKYTAGLAATAKVDLGAGNDTFVVGGNATAGATVTGGDGKDTLTVTNATMIDSTAKGGVYSSFEYLNITGGTGTYDVANLTKSTIEKLVVGTLGANANATVNNLAAGAIVEINANTQNTSNGNLTIGVKDASTTTDDHLQINIGGKAEVTARVTTAANVEKVTVNSTSTLATWADATNKNTITVLAVADATDGLFITGDKNLTISAFTGSTDLTKIDASAFTGKFVMGAALVTSSGAEITGGSKADTIVGTANGDVINGGKGADVITLGAAGAADTLIYAAGDSQAGKADDITNFTSTEDTIDLGAFAFTGTLASAIINKGDINATVAAWDETTASITDFFKAAGVQRGVAISTDATDTYVIVDVNKNGNFDATSDLVIKLTGTAAVVLGDFGF